MFGKDGNLDQALVESVRASIAERKEKICDT